MLLLLLYGRSGASTFRITLSSKPCMLWPYIEYIINWHHISFSHALFFMVLSLLANVFFSCRQWAIDFNCCHPAFGSQKCFTWCADKIRYYSNSNILGTTAAIPRICCWTCSSRWLVQALKENTRGCGVRQCWRSEFEWISSEFLGGLSHGSCQRSMLFLFHSISFLVSILPISIINFPISYLLLYFLEFLLDQWCAATLWHDGNHIGEFAFNTNCCQSNTWKFADPFTHSFVDISII